MYNKQHLIESGLLEQYVLGELSAAEMVRLEKWIASDIELKREVDAIELRLEEFYQLSAVSVDETVKASILETLSSQKNLPVKTAKPVALGRFWPYAAAAGFLLSAILGYLLFSQQNLLRSYQREIASLNADKTVLAGKLDKASVENSLLLADGSRIVSIKGEKANARVIWNPSTGETLLLAESLPKLSDEQDFQLWAISGDQKISAGVFHNHSGTIKALAVTSADAFAVTIEPKGGRPEPTLSNLILVGAVAP